MHHRETNESLLARIKNGDVLAREELAIANIGLVKAKAANMVANYTGPQPKPNYDDFMSAGLLGLWKGILKINGCPHKNVVGYLSRWIVGAMKRETSKEHPTKGLPEGVWLDELEEGHFHCDDDRRVADLRDLIGWACLSDTDRQIVQLRIEGYTFAEIANKSKISKSTINRRLGDIEARTMLKFR